MRAPTERNVLLQKQPESKSNKDNKGMCEPTVVCCEAQGGGSYNVSKCCIVSCSTAAICTMLGIAGYPLGELIVHGAEAAECALKTEGGVACGCAMCLGYSASSCPRLSDFGIHYVPPTQRSIGEPDEPESSSDLAL